MAGSEQDNFASNNDHSPVNPGSRRIARLNDRLRCHAQGGKLVVTAGIMGLGAHGVQAVLEAVRSFDRFSSDNDPHGEHDFGALNVLGRRVFWKIDYYDQHMQCGSPDPADSDVTTRVLTIMLAEEY